MSVTSVRLDEVAQLNPKMPTRLAPQEMVSFIGMADADADTGKTARGHERAFQEVAKGYTQFKSGDILIAKITPCFENGKIVQAQLDHEFGFGSTEFHVVRPDKRFLDSHFLLHFLRQPRVRLDGERRMTGTAGQRRVPEAFLAELRLLMPNLQEQQHIAKGLDQAAELLANRQLAGRLLDDLTRSIFFDMFGNIRASDTVRLGDHLTFVTSGGRGWARYYSDAGSRFIRSLDVRMNEIEDRAAVYVSAPNNAEARRTRVQSDDVLLTITGSLIGRVAPVPQKLDGGYISQHVAILRTDKTVLDPEFLAFFLSLPSEGQRQINHLQYGQTKPGLNFDQIRAMRIPLPAMSEQYLFKERLTAVKGIASSHRAHLEQLDALFASIQNRAFLGELQG